MTYDGFKLCARIGTRSDELLGAVAPLRKSKISFDLLCNATSSRHRVKIFYYKA